jgi:hypothetical protein
MDGMVMGDLRVEAWDVFMGTFDNNEWIYRVYPCIVSIWKVWMRVYPSIRFQARGLSSAKQGVNTVILGTLRCKKGKQQADPDAWH